LLYSSQDVRTNQWVIENARESEEPEDELLREQTLESERAKLREMTFYCATTDCLRGYILKYFGENPPIYCGNCGSCNTNFETVDITVDAQKILSCVVRMNGRFGMNMVIDALRGSKNEKILRLGLNKLSTYDTCEHSAHQLRSIIQHLILNSYLVKTDDEYPVIKPGRRASEILHGRATVHMKLPKEKEKKELKRGKGMDMEPVDSVLFAALRDVRKEIAGEQNMPAFVIFHDSTLKDMCIRCPTTMKEFLKIAGVGHTKAERYGERFLDVISNHVVAKRATITDKLIEKQKNQ